MEKVAVDAKALHQVLSALNGPNHLILELMYTRSLERLGPDYASPITLLIQQYEQAIASAKSAPAVREAEVRIFQAEPGHAGRNDNLAVVSGSAPGCVIRRAVGWGGREQSVQLPLVDIEPFAAKLQQMADQRNYVDVGPLVPGLWAVRSNLGEPYREVLEFHFGDREEPLGEPLRLELLEVRDMVKHLVAIAQRQAPTHTAPGPAPETQMSLG